MFFKISDALLGRDFALFGDETHVIFHAFEVNDFIEQNFDLFAICPDKQKGRAVVVHGRLNG